MGSLVAEEMFGPYRLEELIGRGGMGEVFRARDTVRDREVAIKRLPLRLAADEEFGARFRSEAALVARLRDPHIIPIHDYGEIDGRLFIDMRLVDGRDLGRVLAEHGALPAARAVDVVAQVASALDTAHAEGLVHRDIKPANVLVVPSGAGDGEGCGDSEFVYVADFGLARAVSAASTSLTATGATVGSLAYMAPERFTGGHGDHRADVYALGCLLFEALTGRQPFCGDGLPAVIHAHLNVPPPAPSELVPGLPAGLDRVVARAMAKNPDERYPSAGALAADARAALHTDPVPATEVTDLANLPTGAGPLDAPAPDARKPGRRRRRITVALAIVAGLLAVLAGGSLAIGWGSQDTTVRADPIGQPGDNPFMPPVGQDSPGVTPPPGAGGPRRGDTSGLYGGTLNNASCDPDALVAFLQSHPDKAAAWAGVQGIGPAEIPGYVAGLTPVILRADTAVTNHGFANGAATVVPAVLQAGTAVLVDDRGVPRVRCYCGNPLTPADPIANPRYVGSPWRDLSAGTVTTVDPSPVPITSFTLVDPATGRVFDRPRGSRGSEDRARTSGTSTTSVTATSPESAASPPAAAAAPGPGRATSTRSRSAGSNRSAAAAPPTPVRRTSPPAVTTTDDSPPPVVQHAPVINSTSSYQEGVLVYARINFDDADGDAERFGFQGVNGSGFAPESHPLSAPSFGRTSPGRLDYPFNLACGQPNQYSTDVAFWISDSGDRRSRSVVVHLTCD